MTVVKYWDSVYTDEELSVLWGGIEEIETNDLWLTGPTLGSGETEEGVDKRRGKGFWLRQRNNLARELPSFERVDKVLLKLFQGFTNDYANGGFWQDAIIVTNSHDNLVSYYDEGDHYKAHFDTCPFTAITWLNREPTRYRGGELYFPQLKEQIESRNNRMVIFPGHLVHEVRPVSLDFEDRGKGLGRFSITQFMYNDGFCS